MAYDYIDPKYLKSDNKNSVPDMSDYWMPNKKTQLSQDEVAPSGIDWNKINITPGNNNNPAYQSSGHMGDLQRVDSTLSPFKTSAPQAVKSGFLGGLAAANKAVLEIPNAVMNANNYIVKKLTPNLYKENPVSSFLNNQIDDYSNQQNKYMAQVDNSNTAGKILGNAASFVPQAAEMGLEMSIPLGKLGTVGKSFEGASEPVTELATKYLGKSIPAKIATSGLKTGTEMGLYNAAKSGMLGATPQETGKSALEGFAGGALFGAGGKALGELTSSALPAWKTTFESYEPIKAKEPVLNPGKYEVKNPALEMATQEYNDAIQAIQNYTGHNKLTDDEILNASIDLGIDPFKLIDNMQKAEKGINLSEVGNDAKWKNVIGLQDNLKPLQRNSPIGSTINENLVSDTMGMPTKNATQNGFKLNPDNLTNPENNFYTSTSFNQSAGGNNSLDNNMFTKIKNETIPAENNIDMLNTNFGNGSGKFKTSEFKTNTLKNSEMLKTPETQKIIEDIKAQYEVKPNEQSISKATDELTVNFNGVVNRIKNLEALNSAEDTAASGLITRSLRQEAEKTNDYSQVKSWLETVQPKVTATAQSLQAVKTWKDLSPEGVMFKAQQIVGKVNRDGTKTYGKNFKPVELTTDDLKFIDDTMKKVEGAKDTRAKDLEFGKVKKLIADKIPPSLASKISALQRIQLLLNPKTMVRNTVGNVIMGGLENLKDVPGGLVDKAVSLKTGERTTLLPSIEGFKTQGQGLAKGAKETIQDFKLNVNTAPTRGQFELPETTTFKNPVLNKLEKVTNTGLELGDRPFFQAAYDDSLRQQIKIAKANRPTEAMMEKAKAAAEDRTFQNVSTMVKGFQQLQRGLNNFGRGIGLGNEEFGLGNIVLPFTKTPANILDKAIDYSPLGTLKAIGQLMSKKTFDQKSFVDRIGRSITGSAAILLGYDLAKSGLLTGKANSDKDVAALDRQSGKSAYAFKVGDTYRTFDWAQPAAIPLAIGADIYHQGKDRKSASNVAVEAIKSGGQTLFGQSLLQGLQKLFGGSDAVSGFASSLQGIPTQFLPGSLSKAVTQLKDPYVRDTYDSNSFKNILNQIQAKTPILSEQLPVKIDTMGRETKQYQGNNNPFNVLINPGTTTKYNPTPAEKLALDIYSVSGDKAQFPRVVDTKITYKDKDNKSQSIQLTPQEKQAFQQYIGQKTNEVFSKYANNSGFTSSKTEDQVKELQKRLTEIYNEGKAKILEGRGISEYKR